MLGNVSWDTILTQGGAWVGVPIVLTCCIILLIRALHPLVKGAADAMGALREGTDNCRQAHEAHERAAQVQKDAALISTELVQQLKAMLDEQRRDRNGR